MYSYWQLHTLQPTDCIELGITPPNTPNLVDPATQGIPATSNLVGQFMAHKQQKQQQEQKPTLSYATIPLSKAKTAILNRQGS